MPRDGIADDVPADLDPLTALPAWVKGEKRLSSMLPYVSLVTDRTIRTRGNELMQCIRLEGVNSTTSEDAHLDRIGGLLAGIVAQVGTEFSFYLHKVGFRQFEIRRCDARLQGAIVGEQHQAFAVEIEPAGGIDAGQVDEIGQRALAAGGGKLAEHAKRLVE